MMIVNKPEEVIKADLFLEVQCYKCNTIFSVHILQNINSPFIKECSLHKIKCEHKSDGMIYCSNPPQNKCKICEEFYR